MNGMKSISLQAALVLLPALAPAAQQDQGATKDPVVRWNCVVTEATAASELAQDPISESRLLAIVHLAIHDAVNAIAPRFESYGAKLPLRADASIEAAIAGAAHDAMVELLPASRATIDAALRDVLAALPDGESKTAGLAIGKASAAALLAARKGDGADAKVDHPAGTKPGEYRPTPPDFTPAWKAQWGGVKPFALQSAAQFRPEPPPAVDSPLAKRDVDEVRAFGVGEKSLRNDEQSEIAKFWYEASTQGWNRVARQASATHPLGVAESARMFALLNVAMADGYIAVFEAKYHYDYWRPSTAIRAGGEAEWLNFLPTPPIPDYPSGHTVLGAAAATTMARCFGTDFVAFATTSGAPYAGITREFWSLSEAARENGASRILAGIHFRTAVNAGYRQGEEVGTWACEHALRPLATPAPARVSSSR